MSVGFLFLVLPSAGVLTVILAPEADGLSAPYAVFAPWLACLALGADGAPGHGRRDLRGDGHAAALHHVQAPGGLVHLGVAARCAGVVEGRGPGGRPETLALALVVLGLLPGHPLEQQAPAPDPGAQCTPRWWSAPRGEAVWRNVARVPYITDAEQRGSLFYAPGLPRPREAVLSRKGVGGCARRA